MGKKDETTFIRCPHCGSSVSSGASTCWNCNTALKTSPPLLNSSIIKFGIIFFGILFVLLISTGEIKGFIFLLLVIGVIAYVAFFENQEKGVNTPPQQLQCRQCGNYNIQVTMMQYGQQGVSQTTHQKRSLADRTAYNAGRGAMNMMTMGMWGAFTPKRGKYKEITHTQSRTINQKVAICQYCGFSWNVK